VTRQLQNYPNLKLQFPIRLHLICVQDLSELLGCTLVIAAHADDEAVACGGLLQRMRAPVVVICTDGAPRDEYFWRQYGSRSAYAHIRAREASRAAQAVRVREIDLLPSFTSEEIFVDQELFRRIPQAMECVLQVAARVRPDAVLTLAYEGGHPDHDACNFLGRQLASDLRVPVWEAPLYQRAGASMIVQRFISCSGGEVQVDISPEELARKKTMQAAYVSQSDVLKMFDPRQETLRPMAQYDYSRPPHDGPLNYEAWGWPIRGWELCDQFMQYLNGERERLPQVAEQKIA
jgi:N-acetylglucosamine malate deacetylase 2